MTRLNCKDHVNVVDQFKVERGGGQCDAVCEGDRRQFCGGMNNTSVYSMHDCSHLPPFDIDHCADDPGGVNAQCHDCITIDCSQLQESTAGFL